MEITTYVDNLWVLMAGILVMFMHPGFMLVETGFTRAKNSVNIVMKNFMGFSWFNYLLGFWICFSIWRNITWRVPSLW